MERVEVETYSQGVNGWVVRTPGRKFPALVIQGDSFGILFSRARSVLEGARACECEDPELVDDAEELCELLWNSLRHYEETLQANGFELPYGRVAWQPKR
jgi:hypothetical protein